MSGAPQIARVIVAGALLATVGCVRWTHLAPSQLQINGKAGQLCSVAVTPLVWTVNTVLFPVSVASLGQRPPSHDNLGYPGRAVENVAYFTCATLGLPLSALDWATEQLFLLLANRRVIEDDLIERLPDISPADYALLLRTAGRTFAPPYDHDAPPPADPGAAPPREYGIWGAGQVPRYGSRPRLGNLLAAAEWRDWRVAGRPRGAAAEASFTVNRAQEFSDPALQFAATYGTANQSRFAAEVEIQRARAAALEADAAEASVAVALRDLSPIVRAAAARLRARSRDGGVAGELARLLEDRAPLARAAAVAALVSLAAPESAAALGRAMDDSAPLVRERAALALGTIGTAEAADLLLRSIGNVGHRARFEAFCALASAGRSGSRKALSQALAAPDVHTRIAAAAAIGRTAASPDDPLFTRALGDPDPRVSEAAAHARERRAGSGVGR